MDVVRGSRVLALGLPCSDVVLEATASKVVPEQLTFSADHQWVPVDPLDALNSFGQRVHVWQVLDVAGEQTEVDLGWYQLDSWKEQENGSVAVVAYGLGIRLDEDPMVWPSSPRRGARLLEEAQRLAGDHLPVILDPGVENVVLDDGLAWGRSRTEALRDLCLSLGLVSRVGVDGYLHLARHRTDSRVIDAIYTERDLLLAAPRTGKREGRANRQTVVGSSGSGEDATKFAATAELTTSPFDADYGVVREITEISGTTSRVGVQAAASRAQSDAAMRATTRSLEIVADPRIELGDVIGVKTSTGELVVGRVDGYSLPVSTGGSMRVDLEVLAW
ncbi:hypothetical protein [Oerskovia sp. Root22]|uniref:hypothetical protein n=1 Tax=Oerskovia sp. Root22 TaxID=1736494 RepID=UPI0006F464BB|nr:hypothetical protein [Oerskovia sp. Root22]KRC37531.1 hypothetical protein ASE15_05300 [Oerskovia sp. Root22]